MRLDLSAAKKIDPIMLIYYLRFYTFIQSTLKKFIPILIYIYIPSLE